MVMIRPLAIVGLLALAPMGASSHEGPVDAAGCHDRESQWYDQTIHFEPFKTLKDCLDSGGRLPKS